MKKKLLLVLLIALIVTPTLHAQTAYDKKLSKEQKKEYKMKMKELEKGGWQLFGSSHSYSVALLEHYQRMANDEKIQEFEAEANSPIKTVGAAVLLQDATEKFAKEQSSKISGVIVRELNNHDQGDAAQIVASDKFMQAMMTKVNYELKGVLHPSFTVYREAVNSAGQKYYEFKSYYLVDAGEAYQARMKALESLLQEQVVEHAMSEKTADFVLKYMKEHDITE